VSKEEALQYLKSQKIDEEQAAQIYGLVGGRVVRLKFIADSIKRNGTFEGIPHIIQRTGLIPGRALNGAG
jgi:hypothetical protein